MWNPIIEMLEIIPYKQTDKCLWEEAQMHLSVTLIIIMALAQVYIQLNQKLHIMSKGRELRISM